MNKLIHVPFRVIGRSLFAISTCCLVMSACRPWVQPDEGPGADEAEEVEEKPGIELDPIDLSGSDEAEEEDDEQAWNEKAYFISFDQPVTGAPGWKFGGKIWGCTVQESYVWVHVTGTYNGTTIEATGDNMTDLQLVPLVDDPNPKFTVHIAMDGRIDPADPDAGWCEIDVWTVTIEYQVDMETKTASITNPTSLAAQQFTATCHNQGYSYSKTFPIPFVFAPMNGLHVDVLTTEQCRNGIRPGLGDD
jgi:hypothetical protein